MASMAASWGIVTGAAARADISEPVAWPVPAEAFASTAGAVLLAVVGLLFFGYLAAFVLAEAIGTRQRGRGRRRPERARPAAVVPPMLGPSLRWSEGRGAPGIWWYAASGAVTR